MPFDARFVCPDVFASSSWVWFSSSSAIKASEPDALRLLLDDLALIIA
jgi:hypothetical protein